MKRLLLVLFVLGIATRAHTQITGPDGLSAAPAKPAACLVAHKDAAVNTLVTVTIPVDSGQTIYLCGLDITVSNDATGAVVATNLQFTSTNLWGWAYTYSMAGTANTTGVDRAFTFTPPLRAQMANVAVTIVSPAVNAHAAYSVNVYYFTARTIF